MGLHTTRVKSQTLAHYALLRKNTGASAPTLSVTTGSTGGWERWIMVPDGVDTEDYNLGYL
jgi:hypothetical protein